MPRSYDARVRTAVVGNDWRRWSVLCVRHVQHDEDREVLHVDAHFVRVTVCQVRPIAGDIKRREDEHLPEYLDAVVVPFQAVFRYDQPAIKADFSIGRLHFDEALDGAARYAVGERLGHLGAQLRADELEYLLPRP
jgi:hypothetical protein